MVGEETIKIFLRKRLTYFCFDLRSLQAVKGSGKTHNKRVQHYVNLLHLGPFTPDLFDERTSRFRSCESLRVR